MPQELTDLSEPVITLSKEAGRLIMDIYEQPIDVDIKDDNSPLTQADLASHRCLVAGLNALRPDIPVLSEESSADDIQERLGWQTYWLIDPLDGTKEFIRRNGEFTVNVALIHEGVAVLGVVHAPAIELTYWGVQGAGGGTNVSSDQGKAAFRQEKDQPPAPIRVSENPQSPEQWHVVGSRSHQTPEFADFMNRLPGAEVVSMGSSLKLCLVAEGRANLYPRLGPTSEWDTAAAQAVVEAAGGQVLEYPGLNPLRYNTRPDTLLNPFFIVCSAPDPMWAG